MKHVPMRRCTGCGESRPKDTLLRVVRLPDGSLMPDPEAKIQGRGAYLCKNDACLALAKKKNGFARSFRTAVNTAVYDRLKEVTDV